MVRRTLLLLPALALLGACESDLPPLPAPGMAPASLVLVNGRIRTFDERRPFAEAVAIRGGLLVRVGEEAEARELVGEHTRVLDLGGRLALPGLVDGRTRVLVPEPGESRDDLYQRARIRLRELAAAGVTSCLSPPGGPAVLEVLNLMDRLDVIPARVAVSTVRYGEIATDPDVWQTNRVHPRFAEIPLAGDEDPAALADRIRRLAWEGFTVTLRAESAAAVPLALDAFEAAGPGGEEVRRILSVPGALSAAEDARAAALSVAVGSAPPAAPPDGAAALTFYGTDGPGPGPWPAIAALASVPEGQIEDVLRRFTVEGARAIGLERAIGTVTYRRYADLVVLDRDVLALAAEGRHEEIAGTRAWLTVVDGRIVHGPVENP
jgi:predicted amidohydrolase YtcJ